MIFIFLYNNNYYCNNNKFNSF